MIGLRSRGPNFYSSETVDSRDLGKYSDNYHSNFLIVIWKIVVVFFNWKARGIIKFNEYILFSVYYQAILCLAAYIFHDLRVKNRNTRQYRTCKRICSNLLTDLVVLIFLAIFLGIGFFLSYTLIQFYVTKTWFIPSLISLGVIFVILVFLKIASGGGYTSSAIDNANAVKYGYTYRHRRWQARTPWLIRAERANLDFEYAQTRRWYGQSEKIKRKVEKIKKNAKYNQVVLGDLD